MCLSAVLSLSAERDEAFQDRWAAEAEAKMASESRPKSSPEPAETTVPAVTMQPEASSPRPFIHGRHTCDGCLATPIVGTRYHCLDLPDFDLCHSCHAHYDGPNRFEAVQLGAFLFEKIRAFRACFLFVSCILNAFGSPGCYFACM